MTLLCLGDFDFHRPAKGWYRSGGARVVLSETVSLICVVWYTSAMKGGLWGAAVLISSPSGYQTLLLTPTCYPKLQLVRRNQLNTSSRMGGSLG